jgi:steroid delta-isomerase-like uncharacterized protein
MLTAQDHATLVRSLYDAYNRRDFDKALALVTTDAKWTNIPFGATFIGPKGYREYLENWATAMPDSKVEVINVVVGEEWTAVECVGRGTHTGTFKGPQGNIPATQKKLEMKFCEVLRLDNGQVKEGRVYFDAATLMHQLGVMPTLTPGQPIPSSR